MHNKCKYKKKPSLVRKAQGGLTLPAYNGATGDITSLNKNLQQYTESANVLNSLNLSDKSKGLTSLFGKAGSLSKANSFLSTPTVGNLNIGGLATSALSIADNFIPQAEDKASKATSGVFNSLSSITGAIPGVGLPASLIFKGLGSLFGAGVKNVKGNAADEMVDTSSSYTDADALSDKKFGILGLGAAKDYKDQVASRQAERDTAHSILQSGKDDLLASNNVQQLQLKDNLNKNANNWMYNIRVGEMGMKIKEAKRLSKLAKKKVVTSGEPIKSGTTELREGGTVQKTEPMKSIETITDTFYGKINKLSSENEDPQKPVEMFQNGGQMNVIPSGALHARKHNLTEVNPELEGITPKGIPVVSMDNGELIQHAEVEVGEIIFTKEVTDRLEELRKEGTEEAAIEAGKLLAKQIMENTIDNTNELLKNEN